MTTSLDSVVSPNVRAGIRTVSTDHARRVMVLILGIVLAYWLLFGLTQRSVIEDEGISILAAQSILQGGVMRLPSGLVYHRGYIPHYLLAASIFLFGTNDFAIILPSVLMGLGTLWIVYLFGRDVLGRPWAGVLAVILLMSLQIETFYATSPRMYIALQFFTVAAAYSGWRGYVEGNTRFKLLAILAVAAAILSHRLGGGLLVAIPVSVLAVIWVRRSAWPGASLHLVSGAMLVGAIVYFVFLYSPAGGPQASVLFAGRDVEWAGLNLDPVNWAKWGSYLLVSGVSAIPHTDRVVYLVSLGLVALFMLTGWRRLASDHGLAYTLLVPGILALTLLLYVKAPSARFWFALMPVYAVLVGASIVGLVESRDSPVRLLLANERLSRGLTFSLLIGCAAVVLTLVYVTLAWAQPESAERASILPCRGQAWSCDKSIETHYAYLRPLVRSGDLIVSSNPWVTNFYLGRVDGFLREKIDENGISSTFDFLRDAHFGVLMIDSLDKLRNLRLNERRVWVIADPKVQWASSAETREFLDTQFTQFHQDDITTTYLNCLEPPCGHVGAEALQESER